MKFELGRTILIGQVSMLFVNWALCGGSDLTECPCYVDAHDALYDIAWPRIVYTKNGA